MGLYKKIIPHTSTVLGYGFGGRLWRRRWDFEDLDERVLVERGGDGGRVVGGGGDDERGLEISGGNVLA